MNNSFLWLLKKHQIKKKGLIHIGAHYGEEAEFYNKIQFSKILWIEAEPDVYIKLVENLRRYPNQFAINALVSDKNNCKQIFYVADNDGHSSSILEFDEKQMFRENLELLITKKITLNTSRMQNLIDSRKISIDDYNILVLDVQGAELLILKGMGQYLTQINFIKTEINLVRTYINSVLFHELDHFLVKAGFERIGLSASGYQGEAYYLNKYRNINLFKKTYSCVSSIFYEVSYRVGLTTFLTKRKKIFPFNLLTIIYKRINQNKE